MGKKRTNEDAEDCEAQPKKSKASEEFNGTVFKNMLNEPTRAMKGLEMFISFAKKLPSATLYDVVEGYMKISMECAEIFKLLEGEKHVENEMVLIFHSLEMILLRTASDLSHFSMVGTAIVKKTVTSFMKAVHSAVHSDNHRCSRRCLSFLSAMVSQGPDAAREVFSHFNFSKSLSGLARRRDKMGRPDVRMAYIQFAVSFLISGDNHTIGQVLETKDFLNDILCSGIKEDRMSSINLLLSTLQTKVVQNKAITKTQKVRFFSPAILAHITSLYKWNGIVDASSEETQTGAPGEAAKMVMRELAHSFLMDLCCSRKYGINFYDPSFGTVGKPGNIVLLQFCVGLKQATEDELLADLVVNIMQVCPDLLHRYFKETQYSFTPRLKSAWQDNINLLRKIYEGQPEVSKAFHTREFIPPSRLLSMVMVTSLPPVCNKALFTQGLNMANNVAKHTTLSLVSFILKRALKNIEYAQDKTVWLGSDIYSVSMMEDFVQQYREALSKILPDLTSIIGTWQALTKKEKGEDKGKSKKKEAGAPQKEAEQLEHGPDDAETTLLKAVILQVMCLYQKAVPHLITQSSFDFSKLLKGIVTEKGMREEVAPVLQYQILQLALDLPASKFSWFRAQNIVDTEAAGREKSVFYLLLKMFVTSNSTHLKTSTRMLVLKVLRDTGVFEHTWPELGLWLDHLALLPQSEQETVIQFLERVLVKLVSNPYPYTDKAASLVQEAGYMQANLSGQEGDAVSIPISHIDDVLDMMDVIMEASEGESKDFSPALSEDLILQTFPFSAIVPAALEARNTLPVMLKGAEGVVYLYLIAVLSDILHSQREPLPLCLALQLYDKELSSAEDSGAAHPTIVEFNRYYSQWIPTQGREELLKFSQSSPAPQTPSPGSFTSLMKAAYSKGVAHMLEDDFKETIEEAVSRMNVTDLPVAVKHVLLYIKTFVDNYGTFSKETGLALLGSYMDLLRTLVSKLQSSDEPEEPVSEIRQDESDLFLDVNAVPDGQVDKDQLMTSVLGSIFKHPTLEQWFLATDSKTPPPHSLNPIKFKRLCVQISTEILSLLKISVELLEHLRHVDLITKYLEAVERGVFAELAAAKMKSCPPKTLGKRSLSIQGLTVLHKYLDVASLKEIVLAMLVLPQESLIVGGKPDSQKELSVYGQTVLQVLTENSRRSAQSDAVFLSHEHFRGLGTLLLSCCSEPLETLLLQALQQQPACTKLVTTDLLVYCLQHPSQTCQEIGALLLQNCATHRLQFELWCLQSTNMKQAMKNLKTFLPLVNVYLKTAGREDHTRPKEVQREVLKVFCGALLTPLFSTVLSSGPEEALPESVEVLSSLIKLSVQLEDLTDTINQLPALLQKADSFERWKLVDCISEKLDGTPTQQEGWRSCLLTACFKWLMASYTSHKEPELPVKEMEENMLQRLQGLLASAEEVAASDWNSFVKTGLKYRYRDQAFLEGLNDFLELLYDATSSSKDLVALPMVHMMVTSHSLFLPAMLGTKEEPNDTPQPKEALVTILLTLVTKCPAICNAAHLAVLMGAYRATLSLADQKILLLLQEYERNNISLAEYRSLLWGPAAVEHHKAYKSLGKSLWQQPTSADVLALLNTGHLLQTALNFPQQRRIIPQEGKELLFKDKQKADLSTLYDPCFLLPLFSTLLRPEAVVDCFNFVWSNALGFTVAALSSYDPKVRAASYHVLGSFYHHLEAARFKEKRQLLYLMDALKNGIRQQNLRLPFLLVSYIARVAQQMLKPEEHMYMIVNKFLLTHQYLDLKKVPEFFKLFYSFDLQHKLEREWLLGFIVEGLKDRHCYELCDRQGMFQILLSYYSSPLCDQATQIQILDILQQASHVTKAAYELIKVHGLLTWILQVLEKRFIESRILSSLISLVHALWFTNLGEKESKEAEDSTDDKKSLKSPKCLPLPLINEFLCLLTVLLRHIQTSLQSQQLTQFLQTLCSVLKHRGTALDAHRELSWPILRERTLSCAEALLLLYRWGVLAKDTPLLNALHCVAQKHKVKELLKSVKEKNRVKGSSLQSRMRAEEQTEESVSAAEEQDKTSLAVCEPLLRNVFTYWEPVFQLAPQSENSKGQQPVSTVKVKVGDVNGLDCATACLLVSWGLKSFVSGPQSSSSLLVFLQWIQGSVLPHRSVVDTLLSDGALKHDLLKLFHGVSENARSGVIAMAVLQRFTFVMIQLLQAQTCPKDDLHNSVLKICLPDTTPVDDSRREAGLHLISLYIHELWTGAKEPTMFLTHVSLVMQAEDIGREKSVKKKRHSTAQTAALCICRDISLAVGSL
ncbi:nucleolar pre-ribosomal-associated protein 1 [Amia ocellicauda]|uniref:nucleolar pre-ribosomal-associated protein 1 n=1 Tax=Amia ocellicauda TaxID=2972642 RepID=UPI003463EE3B